MCSVLYLKKITIKHNIGTSYNINHLQSNYLCLRYACLHILAKSVDCRFRAFNLKFYLDKIAKEYLIVLGKSLNVYKVTVKSCNSIKVGKVVLKQF